MSKAGRSPRVALVHDWLTGMRGGEKVLDAVCTLYPDASLYTLVYRPDTISPAITRLGPRASAISRVPRIDRLYRHLLPFYPALVEQFDLDEYDLVISTSHCAAKSVVRPGRARHLCYCFTPMRYVWDQRQAYFGRDRLGPGSTWLLAPVLAWLARWDASTAHRADRYLADSQHVARRILKYYNRRSAVVYPPVDTDFYCPADVEPERSALVVSALVPYKRIDLAIGACRRAGVHLKVVGQGPEEARLRAMAGPGVEFLGAREDAEIRELYRTCGVALLPGEEDFGIVPLEAQACGRPVVALGRGGALETVRDGVTGVLVETDSVEAFADGIRRALDEPFDREAIRRHAAGFGLGRFLAEFKTAADRLLSAPAGEAEW